MKKSYLIAGIIIIVCSAYANANSLLSSSYHHSHDNTSHAAATDKNGCHSGPTGFHCHR